MFNLFKRKNRDGLLVTLAVTTSCEDESVQYADFPDGLRLIFRDGEYVGWYLPGEAKE